MPDEFERVADKLWDRMDKKFVERFDGCTTEACKRARAEVQTVYDKVVTEGDSKTFKELERLNKNLDMVFEEIEKAQKAEVDLECPNCHYGGAEKPEVVGKCPEGCAKFTTHEKDNLKYKSCPICGEEIEWD